MENNLNKWFTAAADAEPIIGVEEVGAMINTTPRSVRVKPTFKHVSIMGASIIIITSLVYWMHMPAEKAVTAPVRNIAAHHHALTETHTKQELIKPDSKWTPQVFGKATVARQAASESEAVTAEPIQQVATELPAANVLEFHHRIVFLTESDLEQLDIHVEQNGYNHYYKTYADHRKIKATQLRSVNDSFYFTAGYPGKNYVIKPWEADYHPLFLTDSLGNQQQNFHFQDCPGNRTYQQFTDSLRGVFLKSYNQLLPIGIRTSAYGRLHVLWYQPTAALWRKLPDYVRNRYGFNSTTNSFNPRPDELIEDTSIVLNHTELAELGIRTDGNTLEYLNPYDTAVFDSYTRSGQTMVMAMVIRVSASGSMSSNNVHPKDSLLDRYANEAVPLLITHRDEQDRVEQYYILNNRVPYTEQAEFVKTMKLQLIPIVVHTKAKGLLYKTDRTFIFWYRNNRVFRSKLPAVYAGALARQPDFDESGLQQYIKELNERQHAEAERNVVSMDELRTAQQQFIQLPPAALKKLGIHFSGEKLDYKVVSVNLDNHPVTINLLVTPDAYRVSSNHKSGKAKLTDVNRRKFAWYVTDSSLNIVTDFVDPVSPVGDQVADEERTKKMHALFKQRMDSLVPVLVRFTPEAIKRATQPTPQTHVVFWFPQSAAVQQVLDNAVQQEAKKAEIAETAISSIHYLELSDSVLWKLGISKEGKFLKVPNISNEKHLTYSRYSKSYSEHMFTMGSDSPSASAAEIGDIVITTSDPFAQPMKVKPSYPKVVYPTPLLITDGTGLHWRLFQWDDAPMTAAEKDSLVKHQINPSTNRQYLATQREHQKNALIKRLNTMIAIRVKSDETYTKNAGRYTLHPDLIIWYDPDSLFLSRLPAALAQHIQDELSHVQANSTGAACTYFEACANKKGVITQHLLYPNPAADKANLDLVLADARNLSITVTDISGKVAKTVVAQQPYSAGNHTIAFSLAGLSEGMYLLVIESDKGERIVQRLVKK